MRKGLEKDLLENAIIDNDYEFLNEVSKENLDSLISNEYQIIWAHVLHDQRHGGKYLHHVFLFGILWDYFDHCDYHDYYDFS